MFLYWSLVEQFKWALYNILALGFSDNEVLNALEGLNNQAYATLEVQWVSSYGFPLTNGFKRWETDDKCLFPSCWDAQPEAPEQVPAPSPLGTHSSG